MCNWRQANDRFVGTRCWRKRNEADHKYAWGVVVLGRTQRERVIGESATKDEMEMELFLEKKCLRHVLPWPGGATSPFSMMVTLRGRPWTSPARHQYPIPTMAKLRHFPVDLPMLQFHFQLSPSQHTTPDSLHHLPLSFDLRRYLCDERRATTSRLGAVFGQTSSSWALAPELLLDCSRPLIPPPQLTHGSWLRWRWCEGNGGESWRMCIRVPGTGRARDCEAGAGCG